MQLEGVRVAILVCDGFEEVELTEPHDALQEAGAIVDIVSPNTVVTSWQRDHWGRGFPSDVALCDARPQDYDALLLPGGVLNPDKLRMDKKAVAFVKHFIEKDKLIAAICHGPWTLIETNALKGRKMTSYMSIKTDLINAGADWVNKEVVIDGNLITSRSPKDLPAFNKRIIKEFARAKREPIL